MAAADPMNRTAHLYALVPCAGSGTRSGMSGPKQYAMLAGRAMVAHTLAALAAVPRIEATLVVLAAADDQFERHAPAHRGPRAWVARCGGATRADSVAAGIEELRARGAADEDRVLVHDAARCLVQAAWIERLIDACAADPEGGLLALPLSDTLKAEHEGRAAATIDRSGKWLAQTPQLFPLGLLQRALAAAGSGVTDEASAIEAFGHRPQLVRGDARNLKVTHPDDLALADALLRALQ